MTPMGKSQLIFFHVAVFVEKKVICVSCNKSSCPVRYFVKLRLLHSVNKNKDSVI